MAAVQLSHFVGRVRGALAARETAGFTDAALWERYVRERDEAAFEALVREHGPMVFNVCRRLLRHEQDAEDAFQATFLVLVRKAASLRSPRTIANWLYGVARRTALEGRNAAAKRRAKESALLPRTADEPGDDLQPVLDQELGRLAEKYRIAVVLCDLEGKTRKEVARQLGWAEGTVASRLARGRCILAKRLARRGFAGALVAAALAGGAAEDGRIEIREVWGTRPQIEVGGQYLVRGKYKLPAGVHGKLYFYATAGGAWGAVHTTLDLQYTALDKQEGEFALVHGMSGPGNFHLILTAADDYSRCFANVYFGTGDNVLK